MEIVKNLNLGLSFLLELAALASLGYWGFQLDKSTLVKVAAGIGAPLAVAVIWGIWLAPNSGHRIAMPWLVILKLLLFGLAALALYASGQTRLAASFTALVAINVALSLAFNNP